MKKSIVFMFSGQGSQYYQMGKELYEMHPRFKLWMDHCDKILCPLIDISLIDVLYHQGKKTETFDKILYTNPALLCIEYSLARVLMEMGFKPDYLLGYSLGEITASVVSGAVSLEEGIRLTVEYAKLLEKESPAAAMLAVIESTQVTIQYPELFENCWVTGINFKKSFVVSGLPQDVQRLQLALNEKNIISQKLPVNFGFHTELMDPLEEKFKQLVRKINISPIRTPIISALRMASIEEINTDYLWEVTRYPIEFEKTINSILQQGSYIFIDVGPSGTLATFVKYLLPADSDSLYVEVINQFGKDLKSLEKLTVSLRSDACLST
ncbi:MAG: acyltransferase domain-containing protein [Pseudomonadota bacterium]